MTSTMPVFPDLAGKVAVVTGGASGIGAEMCRYFAANDMKVAVADLEKDAIESIVQDIGSRSGEAIGVVADCTDRVAIENVRDTAERELGPVDVLVTVVGGDVGAAPLEQVTEESWHSVIDSNLTSAFLTVRAFLPGMIERRGGSIITMSSAAGRLPGRSSVAYATAKAAILMFTRRVALDVGKYNVRINAIAPSAILTEKVKANLTEEFQKKVAQEEFLIHRWGTPADCANTALFLASEASSWITGQTTDITGGKIML